MWKNSALKIENDVEIWVLGIKKGPGCKGGLIKIYNCLLSLYFLIFGVSIEKICYMFSI